MFLFMKEDIASAGDGPAPDEILEKGVIPAATRLRATLAACESLLGDCARVASDKDESSAAQMVAAATAAKLASASALAASAIARLADAETHQRLATAKIELSQMPRRFARREPAYGDPPDYRAEAGLRAESEKSANNPGPRIWTP